MLVYSVRDFEEVEYRELHKLLKSYIKLINKYFENHSLSGNAQTTLVNIKRLVNLKNTQAIYLSNLNTIRDHKQITTDKLSKTNQDRLANYCQIKLTYTLITKSLFYLRTEPHYSKCIWRWLVRLILCDCSLYGVKLNYLEFLEIVNLDKIIPTDLRELLPETIYSSTYFIMFSIVVTRLKNNSNQILKRISSLLQLRKKAFLILMELVDCDWFQDLISNLTLLTEDIVYYIRDSESDLIYNQQLEDGCRGLSEAIQDRITKQFQRNDSFQNSCITTEWLKRQITIFRWLIKSSMLEQAPNLNL